MKKANLLRLFATLMAATTIVTLAVGCKPTEEIIEIVSYVDGEAPDGTDSGDSNAGDENSSGGDTSDGPSSTPSGTEPTSSGSPTNPQLINGKVTISSWSASPKPAANDKNANNLVKELEEKYNCTFEWIFTADPIEYYGNFTAATMAGKKYADIVHTPGDLGFPNAAINKCLTQLDGIVDLKNPCWNQNVTNNILNINGKHYYVQRYDEINGGGGIYFNKAVFSRFNQKTPYDYIDSNSWTLDTFKTLAKAMTRTDGGKQYYGLAKAPVLFSSYGVQPILKDANSNKHTFNLDNAKAYEAIQFAYDLYNVDKVCPTSDDETLFDNGYVAMIAGPWYSGGDYKDGIGASNLGFAYHPKLKATDDYIYFGDAGGIMGIPSTVKNAKAVAALMTDWNGVYNWRPTLEDRLANYVGDERGLEIAVDAAERNSKGTYWPSYYPNTYRDVFWTDYGISKQTSPQSFIASVKAAAQQEIDAVWEKADNLK